jgi:hypothetical protein
MKKAEAYTALFLGCLAIYTLGTYTMTLEMCNEEVPLYRWVFTTIFGFMFLSIAITKFKEIGNDQKRK